MESFKIHHARITSRIGASALVVALSVGCATTRELNHKVDEESASAIEGEAGKKIAASKTAVAKAEMSAEAADQKVVQHDSAISDAQARIDKEKKAVQNAEDQLDAAKKRLDFAEHAYRLQELKKETFEALAEVKKDVTMVEKAKHELTKYKAVAAAQGVAGPLYQENLARFEAQLAEKQKLLAEAKERHAGLQGDLASEQQQLDSMRK